MRENQNIEYKQNWRDEYLKWICGFANAQGGKLFIGKNDKGIITGISNAGKLLEDIPNKDYSSGAPIQISVYSNKIIFWNVGQLPANWTVKKLSHKHPSIPYNPDIANTFFRAGLIEAWGRGTLKIISECIKAKLPVPEYKYDLSGFIVEIYRREVKAPSDKLGDKLGDKRRKIIKLMRSNQLVSISELSKLIGISNTAIENNIKYLKGKGFIERIGGAKDGHWEVKGRREI